MEGDMKRRRLSNFAVPIAFLALHGFLGVGSGVAWADPVNPFVNLSYGFTLATDSLFQSFSDSQTNVSSLGNSFSLVENPGSGPGPHRGGSTILGGTAQYGQLHSSTQVSGVGNPLGFDPGMGKGIANVSFNDILTVVDNNVPSTTPVTLGFKLTLDGAVDAFSEIATKGTKSVETSAFAGVVATFGASVEVGSGRLADLNLRETACTQDGLPGNCGQNGAGSKDLPGGQLNDIGEIVLSGVLTTTPNARIDIQGTLGNESFAVGATNVFTCGTMNCFEDLSANAGADLSHTVILTVTSLTPGASFESASGASYSGSSTLATPEPRLGVPLACGLLIIGMSYRRRTRSR
jgi:hypothetical protein